MRPRRTFRYVVIGGVGLATVRLMLACGIDAVGLRPDSAPDDADPGNETTMRDSDVPSNDSSAEEDAIDAPSSDALDAASEDVVAEEAVAPRPLGIVCGAANCSATDTCLECAAARTCDNNPGGCTGGGWFRCDDPTECTATDSGSVCCVDTISGASVNARCEADAAGCVSGGVLCDPGSPTPCGGNKQCLAASGRLAGRFTCQ